jgi:hypothetical protein
MKINISAKELKEILSDIIGICVEIGDNDNFMNKPEEPTVLSDEEVHNIIVEMCMHDKVKLYINEKLNYATDRPNYDMIAEELHPYDGEIISIIGSKDGNNWFVNTI